MRRSLNTANTNIFHIMLDILFGGIAYLLAVAISGNFMNLNTEFPCTGLAFLLIYIISQSNARAYNTTTFFYVDRFIKFISRSWLFSAFVLFLLLFFVGHIKFDIFYLHYPVFFYLLMFVSLYIARTEQKKNTKTAKRAILIGNKNNFGTIEHFMNRSNIRLNIVGYVSYEPAPDSDYLGSVNSLYYILHEYTVDEIYFLHRHDDPVDIQEHIDFCMRMGITVRIILGSFNYNVARSFVTSMGTYPVVTMHTVNLSPYAQFVKRFFDVLLSGLGIIISSPILLITAIAIKLDSPGPVIFKQTRIGLNGRPFKIFKFRSMCNDADAMKSKLLKQNENSDNHMFKMKNDPRITKVGRFIRKTSIDELPQLFNVIRGDMSLIGTRPPTADEVKDYNIDHWRRLSIKPGITGMWQVSGRSQIKDFDNVVALDVQYIDNWSIWLDLKILFKTVWVVVAREGAE